MSSAKERWLDFRFHYETGWLDPDRQKTIQAMERLRQRLPHDAVLPKITVFAPGRKLLGRTAMYETEDSITLVYLSPELEKKSQQLVDLVTAHEIAHVWLGHHKPRWVGNDRNEHTRMLREEEAADRLALSWLRTRPG